MNIQRLFLNIGLALIIPSFILQATLALFPEPRWEQFNKELPGYWYETATLKEKKLLGEEQQVTNRRFTIAQQLQQKKIFLVVVPAGILLIIIGSLSGLTYLGSALIGAGIFTIFRSYFVFNNISPDGQWFNVSMKWRALIFGIATLVMLSVELYNIWKERPQKKTKKKSTKKAPTPNKSTGPDIFLA